MASYSCYFTKVLVLLFLIMSYFISLTSCKSSTSRLPHNTITEEDLVSATCKKTLYFQLCVSSLRSDPQSQTSDLRGLAVIALNLSIENGVKALSYINNLMSEAAYKGSQLASTDLSDCVDVYSDAIQNLQDSVQALNDMSFDTVQSFVSAAMTDSETCEDGFKEFSRNLKPPFPLISDHQTLLFACGYSKQII
ncbi:hypothetical protein F8388_003671 [Cannabis sativa]|uniref:Pectinesterase inhibitor domain-containing protein n=1 Tax=Cannabis sativa TaxID=3483 RepID=A0A7J6F6U7_CANSA|nr:hypothetical protein F8388_003671 [Cannabis sativa]